MTMVADVRVVHAGGAPRERGRVQGEALRPAIAAAMGCWKENLAATTGFDPEVYLDRFVAATAFLPAIERWAPHLLEEVRGIGEGAGVSFRDIYAYQLMDEEWLYRRDLRRAAKETAEHCSVIATAGELGSRTLLAQNMDLPKYYDGSQTLLHVRHEEGDLEALVFTAAGLLGLTGLNSNGVGICCNTLGQLSHAREGLPVAFVVRRALEASSLERAAGFVQAITHASGQNYVLGGPGRVVDFECSSGKVVQYAPGSIRLFHTNHPLANDDLPGNGTLIQPVRTTEVGAQPAALSNSEQRYAYLEREVGAGAEAITVERAQALLSTCEVPINVARGSAGDSMTLGSLVMELNLPALHYAPGPPAEDAYSVWTF